MERVAAIRLVLKDQNTDFEMFIQVFTQDRLSTAVVVMTSHSNKE
jgi:hypothetical protein